jgi:hypothetical protein
VPFLADGASLRLGADELAPQPFECTLMLPSLSVNSVIIEIRPRSDDLQRAFTNLRTETPEPPLAGGKGHPHNLGMLRVSELREHLSHRFIVGDFVCEQCPILITHVTRQSSSKTPVPQTPMRSFGVRTVVMRLSGGRRLARLFANLALADVIGTSAG